VGQFDVGLYASYACRDSAWPAGALAAAAEAAGLTASVYPSGERAKLYPPWDERLAGPAMPMPLWVKACRHVVLFDPPTAPVREALSVSKPASHLAYSWLRHTPRDLKSAPVGRVLCPTRAAWKAARAAGAKDRAVYLPWAAGFAPLPAAPAAYRKAVLWVADVRRETDVLPARAALDALLARPDVFVTVLFQGRPKAAVAARLRQAAAAVAGRLDVVRESRPDQLVLLMARHDLAVLPTLGDDFGVLPLAAGAAGLPVVCYDHPALSDVVRDGVSGALVGCELAADEADTPWAVANDDALAAAVLALVDDPPRVARLRAGTQKAASTRHQTFVKVAGELLSEPRKD
jgi:glycosyltransferase involved in cell wall biosynthesis